MTFKHYLKMSAVALRTNKARSFLTILGIVIGIAAIILIVSLGQGAQKLILAQIQGLGSKSVVVIPGRQLEGPPTSVSLDSLKEKDLKALENKVNVPHAASVIPVVFGSEIASYESQNFRAALYGSSPEMTTVFDAAPTEGLFFTNEDINANASVVVIGSKTRKELFSGKEASDILGQRIKIKNKSFKIIGILPSKGSTSLINFDDAVIIPYSTAQNYLYGIKHFDRLLVDVDNEANLLQTVGDVTRTMRNSHNIDDPDKDDFSIVNQAELAKSIGVITGALTYFLAAVAAISLLVGGIGIMNIMLVSVTERTREIGLRKAVGATTKNILIQFLFESILLTLVGGITGIILGTGAAYVASIIINRFIPFGWQFVFPLGATILGVLVSAVIGLGFGVYPARKAAKKSPIEALRYE